MNQEPRCPHCGKDLPPGAREGLCVACLLKAALRGGSETEAGTIEQGVGEGLRFGPYTTVSLLGEGGMGVVYLARQEQPIHRTVALKVIKPGMASPQAVSRFAAERDALALMDHPNIARVFDAGSSDDGRPYFAMEYVPGIPLIEYCDAKRLTTRERLEVFRQVCLGIHHAHQKGIIHRDIKPSNVLVEFQDGKPVPKVIDFGVAKAIRPRVTEQTLFTEAGVLIGTPEYMSPEQAQLTAHEVDTATDIYSLGVLLYELLVGALPFEAKELRRAGYLEILRRIREDEPPSPADRLKTMGGTAAEMATRRRTDTHSLERQLRGDLEWITMRAIEKDRIRRYPSASELAADIARHLNDEPVLAGPPGRMYRIGKFVRKNRLAVSAVVAIAICVLTGLAVSIALYFREQRQRDIAERQSYVANLGNADALIRACDFDGAREGLFQCVPRLRGWEWRLLYSLSDTSIARLHGKGDPHEEEINPFPQFGFSRDGSRFFFHMLRSVHAWEIGSWQPAGDYGASGRILAMSQDGSMVVVRAPEKIRAELTLIEPASGRRLAVLHDHPNASTAAFSPDGTLVASASYTDGAIKIWDTSSGLLIASTLRPASGLLASFLVFSPDSRYLACGFLRSSHQQWQVLDARTGKPVRAITDLLQRDDRIITVAFSRDGRHIAAGSSSGTVRIWDLRSTGPPRVLPDSSTIMAIAWNHDSTRIITATYGRAVRVWDVDSGAVLASLSGGGLQWALAVAFSPDDKWIMAGWWEGEVRVWDAATLGQSILARVDSAAIALSPDGKRIAVRLDRSTAVLDAASGRILLRYPVPALSAAFNRAGDRLAIGASTGRIEVIDPLSGATMLSWPAHGGKVWSLDFSNNNRYIASSSSDGTARIWDATTARQLATIELPGKATKVVFHPGGDILATSAKWDSPVFGVRLWHVPSGKLALEVAPKSIIGPYARTLAFSPDGRRVASNETLDQIRVSDTATGKVLAILKGGQITAPSVAFSPDGKLIATAGEEEIRLWDAIRYERLLTLRLPGTAPEELTFSPDGSRLFAVCSDRAFSGGRVLRVWDAGVAGTSTARELVAQLARRYPLLLDVRRHLESDPALDEATRSAAVQMCWPAADTLGPLVEHLVVPLLSGRAGRSDLTTALRRSEAYDRLFPLSSDGPLYLGVAQYRNQLYDEAIRSLSRATAAGSEDPLADAFLAMAFYRTGRVEDAQKSLERARVMLRNTDDFRRRIESRAITEAEALLSGKEMGAGRAKSSNGATARK